MSSWLDFAIDDDDGNSGDFVESPHETTFTMRPKNVVLSIYRVSAPITFKMNQNRALPLMKSEKMSMSQSFKIPEFQIAITN